MDSTVLSALIAALVALAVAWMGEQRKIRADKRAAREKAIEKAVGADVAVRIREIDAVEEFRDALRQTIKDHVIRIERLEKELEAARLDRLKHERERLEWFQERISLRERLSFLENLLHVHEIDIPHSHEEEEYSPEE